MDAGVNKSTQPFDILQSWESSHARASLCKSFAKALLNDPTTADCLTLSNEDALYACCNTYGAQSPRILIRIDQILNTLFTERSLHFLKTVLELKSQHVIKRDRQRHLACMYRRREKGIKTDGPGIWRGRGKKERYEAWAKICDAREEAEGMVIEALEELRGRLRGEFSRLAMGSSVMAG